MGRERDRKEREEGDDKGKGEKEGLKERGGNGRRISPNH